MALRTNTDGSLLSPEDFSDTVETAKAVRQIAKRVPKPVTLEMFVDGCIEATKGGSCFRSGGMLIDFTTASMVAQVWELMEKHPKADELKLKLGQCYTRRVEANKGKTRVAIADAVDRFWKVVSPKTA